MSKESREKLKQISKENKKAVNHYEKIKKRKNIDPSEYIVSMKNTNNVIEFDNLKTYFYTDIGIVKAVNGVSFDIPKGKTVALVGESGCGKSVTNLTLMRLVQGPSGQIVGGEIRYKTESGEIVDLTKIPMSYMEKIRGNEISMIFQEPMTSLNPVFTIGQQISETIELHNKDMSKNQIKDRTVELLTIVGISRADEIYKSYPHQLSGGMRQRVMIAMSLSCNPKLIIADEPTTALDVTIQAQILDLMRDLKNQINASILLITHDLGVVAEMADYVVVMYAGKIVEQGTAMDIYNNPKHPYTIGLLKSKPVVNKHTERLYSISGQVPNPVNMPNYCYFKSRCEKSFDKCSGDYPSLNDLGDGHKVSCWLYDKDAKGER